MVAGFLYQGFSLFEMSASLGAVGTRESEATGSEVVVGEVKAHAGARGDMQDFVEVVVIAASKKSERKHVELSSAAEEIDGLIEVVVCRPGWKWRKRSSVKITERAREEIKKALHWRREGRHFEATFAGAGAGFQAL